MSEAKSWLSPDNKAVDDLSPECGCYPVYSVLVEQSEHNKQYFSQYYHYNIMVNRTSSETSQSELHLSPPHAIWGLRKFPCSTPTLTPLLGFFISWLLCIN